LLYLLADFDTDSDTAIAADYAAIRTTEASGLYESCFVPG
jgi:hypothetical protein